MKYILSSIKIRVHVGLTSISRLMLLALYYMFKFGTHCRLGNLKLKSSHYAAHVSEFKFI